MKNRYYQNIILAILVVSVLFTSSSCRKFVQVDTPPNKITQANVFSTDKTATSVLTGILVDVQRIGPDLAEYGGLLSDEWILWAGANYERRSFYTNNAEATSSSDQTKNTGKQIWSTFYTLIFKCNSAIEGIKGNTQLSPFVQKQLLGEVYFIRAWLYFYLVNLWGDLPLALAIDPEVNRLLRRSAVTEVYNVITNDLLQARELLTENYVDGRLMPYSPGDEERVRPNKWVATALLSRVYLYTGQWIKAEVEAEKIINNTNLFVLKPLSEVFLKNSQETIWQLQPVDAGYNTLEARRFNLSASPTGLSTRKQVHLSQFTLGAFEAGDQRRISWVDSLIQGSNVYYYPGKMKIAVLNPSIKTPGAMTEYCMMLRLSEQYLIRAEAKARQGRLPEAISDIDKIRDRAGLPLIVDTNPSISQEELLNAILHERQAELFTEWGHRWFDIKRFGKADEIMSVVSPVKGGSWQTTDQLLPIPLTDLMYNPNMQQNPSY